MMLPTLPGWKVETCGDDIAWIHADKNTGKLHAINPENGFFGVAPGTSKVSNPNALEACRANTIFTNVVLTDDGDVWWEDMGVPAPAHGIDWKGNDCYASKEKPNKMVANADGTGEFIKAAHPNSRFTAPADQCPVIAKEWEDPAGVPVDAILFGGRRPSTIPLVNMATDWAHGVYMGSAAGSEVTAAVISDQIGQVRRDPMAMLPFCGYNMADYFGHWLAMGEKVAADKLPKVFFVNWFRKDADGNFMWPGFGDNSRVLKWVCEAIEGKASTKVTPIGIMPTDDAIDLAGCETTPETLKELLTVDVEGWKKEVAGVKESWEKFGDRIPAALTAKLAEITEALNK
jgi:phosphoenolpyruvate carboxykinase (GTP)